MTCGKVGLGVESDSRPTYIANAQNEPSRIPPHYHSTPTGSQRGFSFVTKRAAPPALPLARETCRRVADRSLLK